MNALLESEPDSQYSIDFLVTDNPLAAGITLAQSYTRDLLVIPWCGNRQQWSQRVQGYLQHIAVDMIVLAGFMRILSADFVAMYQQRIINIHPSLLPDFKGLDTHARALAAGVSEHGFSIHLVTAELDAGQILAQEKVPICIGDSPTSLQARVQEEERRCYPQVLNAIASGQFGGDGGILTRENNM